MNASTSQTSSFAYPQNEDGSPEYGSVIITLDHLSAGREGDPNVRNKMVFSTEDEIQTVISLFAYYQNISATSNAAVVKLLGSAANADFPVIVYSPAAIEGTDFQGNTQIVLPMPSFSRLLSHPDFGNGSMLMMVDGLAKYVSAMAMEMAPEGQAVPLFFFELEVAPVEAEEAAPAPRTSRGRKAK